MGWFWLAIILFVIAALFLLFAGGVFFAKRPGDAAIAGVVAVVLVVLGGLVTVACSYDRVDTRNVGIVTSFGNPVSTRPAGIAWHKPWEYVSELPESIQLQAFESNSYDDASKGSGADNNPAAINVRLANNSNAYVDINLNWRIREGAAGKMFQDYGGTGGGDVFDKIKQQLVDRQAQVMVSKVFSTFNPQTAQPVVTPPAPGQPAPAQPAGNTPAAAQGADLPGMATQVKKDLQDAVGQEIEILDVRIPRLWYSGTTQDRIDDYNKKVQETINAAQDAVTAQQTKVANDLIASSVSSPLTIVARCVDKQIQAAKDPGQCWGPMGNAGGAGGAGVLVTVPKPGS